MIEKCAENDSEMEVEWVESRNYNQSKSLLIEFGLRSGMFEIQMNKA